MSFRSRLWAAIPSALLVALLAPGLSSQGATATAAVDFAAGRSVNSASGLLFGVTLPIPADRFSPLQPRFWRYSDYFSPSSQYYTWTALAQAFLALAPGARLNMLLAQDWGFPLGNWNGTHQPPWVNWQAYESYLTNLARMLRTAGLNGTFEVWNEPDQPDFWNGTRDQFHELYARAYTILRAELGPDAEIAGPSFGAYNHAAMEAFLEFCLARGCQVNAMTFHAADDSPAGVAAFAPNVQDARTAFVDNPRYAPLRIGRIITNEIVGWNYTRQPAGTLAYYAAFEASGAAHAARACWSDHTGTGECFNGTMDGLLTAGTFQTRSVWWAHSLYAAGVSSRVVATANTANLVVLGSAGSAPAPPQVLIGHVNFPRTIDRQPATLLAQLTMNHITALPAFATARRALVAIDSIPDSGEAALAGPVARASYPANVIAGTLVITLPAMQVGEVLRVTLQPLDGGPPDPPEGFQAAVADNAVSLRWSAPPSGPAVTGYVIEAGSAPDTANLLQLPLGAVTGFDASAPTGTYYLRVKSTNAYGAGEPTTSVRVDAGCATPPGPPIGLQGQIASSSVTLAWQRGAGNVGRYVLEAGSATGLSNLAAMSLAPSSTTFAATAPPGTYFIRVRAANSCGVGPPSTEVSLVVGSGSELPGPPGTPSAAVTGSTVSLAWTAPAIGGAPTAYRLEAGTSPGLANAALVTLSATPAFSASGAPRGTYYVRVRAMNPAGVGPPSPDATVTVP